MLFGAQVKQAGGLLAALRRAEAMGARVMQVFAQSPRQWRYPEANAGLQGLPAVLEVPGTDNQGPDARELKRVRRLHAEGVTLRARAVS